MAKPSLWGFSLQSLAKKLKDFHFNRVYLTQAFATIEKKLNLWLNLRNKLKQQTRIIYPIMAYNVGFLHIYKTYKIRFGRFVDRASVSRMMHSVHPLGELRTSSPWQNSKICKLRLHFRTSPSGSPLCLILKQVASQHIKLQKKIKHKFLDPTNKKHL